MTVFNRRGVIEIIRREHTIAVVIPYFWADGVTPRKSDGLTWQRSDLVGDGTHPSDTGRQKVAEQLLNFFKTDAHARTWFVNE